MEQQIQVATELKIATMVPLGDSGIYIDSEQMAKYVNKWIEETPPEIKREQIQTIAIAGILIFGGTLLVLALMVKR